MEALSVPWGAGGSRGLSSSIRAAWHPTLQTCFLAIIKLLHRQGAFPSKHSGMTRGSRHINDNCTHVLFIQVHSSWSLRVNSVISDYYGFSQIHFIPVTYEHLCWLVFTMSGFCHFGNLLRQHFFGVTVTFQKLSIYKQTTPSGSVTVWFSGSWTKGHSSRNFFRIYFQLLLAITAWSRVALVFLGRERLQRHPGKTSVLCAARFFTFLCGSVRVRSTLSC